MNVEDLVRPCTWQSLLPATMTLGTINPCVIRSVHFFHWWPPGPVRLAIRVRREASQGSCRLPDLHGRLGEWDGNVAAAEEDFLHEAEAVDVSNVWTGKDELSSCPYIFEWNVSSSFLGHRFIIWTGKACPCYTGMLSFESWLLLNRLPVIMVSSRLISLYISSVIASHLPQYVSCRELRQFTMHQYRLAGPYANPDVAADVYSRQPTGDFLECSITAAFLGGSKVNIFSVWFQFGHGWETRGSYVLRLTHPKFRV